MNPLKSKRALIPLFLFAMPLQVAGQLVSVDFLQHYSESQLDIMGLNAENGADVYRLTYETPFLNQADTASGALILPTNTSCANGHPFISYQHGTVMKDDQVPSENGARQQGLYFAGKGYVVGMPDYLGLGESEGLHPYHHAESQAVTSLNMIRASREHLEGDTAYPLSGELFLTGYSQGGHATMALHHYIETNAMLDSFNVKASAPLSGAYDLSGVQSELPPDSLYPAPAYYPYIIESYQMVYGGFYDSLEEYYEAPYDSIIPKCLDGDTSLQEFNNILPNNLYYFMEDSVLDAFYADTVNFSHPLRLALANNDLYDWAPQRKVRLYYCGGDQQVYPKNSMIARDSMLANGANDVEAMELSSTAGHSQCIPLALQQAGSLFEQERSACGTTAVAEHRIKKGDWELRNLSNDRTMIRSPEAGFSYKLYSIQGRPVRHGSTQRDRSVLNTASLPDGIYLIHLKSTASPSYAHRKLLVD